MLSDFLNNYVLAAGGLFDFKELFRAFGYIGIVAIIFAESGLLIGFFLPGDSLLFTAGVVASGALLRDPATQKPLFDITLLCILCFIAAVTGDSVGYWFGNKVGPRIFSKEDSFWFNKNHILKAQAFYEKHGGKTIILARFIPVVRTFAPIVAGVGKMKYTSFLMFNVVGGFLWAVGVTLGGYFLGSLIPADDVDKYLLPIIFLIILVSIAPPAWHILKEKENREHLMQSIRRFLKREKAETKTPVAVPQEIEK